MLWPYMGKPSITAEAEEKALMANPEPAKRPKKYSESSVARLEAVAIAVAEKMGFRILPSRQPLKASPETIEIVLSYLNRGLSLEKAVIMAGVPPALMDQWRKANSHLDGLFKQAWHAKEAEVMDLMLKHAKEESKASGWVLERVFGHEARSRTEVTGANGGPITSLTIHKQLLSGLATGKPAPVTVEAEVIPAK